MDRNKAIERLGSETAPWDFIIIGGGATGLGCAVDAASRGYRTLLVERHDFAKGTSSRSTKLVHGGLRYLRQGNLSLVLAALRERGLLRRNAPHLVHKLGFVIPAYRWHDKAFYGAGLRIYDSLAGKFGLGPSRILSRNETLERLPTLNAKNLRGGIMYFDGQFDDARLAITLARTAADHGATVLNYAKAVGFIKEGDRVSGVQILDEESGARMEARGRCVINAAGVFCDEVRRLDDPLTPRMLVFSQGSHLVFDKHFHPGDDALMIPKTEDGRVLFAVPWHDRVIIGTTDVPVEDTTIEPAPNESELSFLFEHAKKYLCRHPEPGDALSVFCGLRALVASGSGRRVTSSLSRDHTIMISGSGLVTVTGGKWTTYRKMAADAVEQAQTSAGFEHRPCQTERLFLHGWREESARTATLAEYGSDADEIEGIARGDPELAARLHPRLPAIGAEIVWAARHEMARTVEDVLARRTRSLVLDTAASIDAAPDAARLLAHEIGRDDAWASDQVAKYCQIARRYLIERYQ